jgi:hypothetical protein
MRRLSLAANVPSYAVAAELAKGIRLFDKDAIIRIQEGRGCGGAFEFYAKFDLSGQMIRYSDLKLMFKNSVEASGGKILSS